MLHWIYCNIYTLSYTTVTKRLVNFTEKKAIKDYVKRGETY